MRVISNTVNAYDARRGVAVVKPSPLFAEPTDKQAAKARNAVAELKAQGWGYKFHPYNTLGERVAIVDPGNRGRLDAATRQRFNASKVFIEILAERSLALSRCKPRGVAGDASLFLERALKTFPGSRIYF